MQVVSNHQSIIDYSGNLSYEEIGVLLNRMTLKLSDLGLKLPVKKKVYSIMVEMLENIYKHKGPEYSDQHTSKFELKRDSDEFVIQSSNLVEKTKSIPLKEKLDLVNGLDEVGLKELYKSTILNDQISEKGGAGLGIINIAKISCQEIDYNFKDISNEFTYFTVNVKLKF